MRESQGGNPIGKALVTSIINFTPDMAHISSNIWCTLMYLVTTFLSVEYTHLSQVHRGIHAKYLHTVFAMKVHDLNFSRTQ